MSTRRDDEEGGARWDNELTIVFADLVVEQVRRRRRGNNRVVDGNSGLSKKTWKSICEGFYSKTGLPWDMEKLKDRFQVLRRQHAIVKSLLRHDSFRFDAATGFVIGGNAAWAGVIQGYPDAEAIKSSGCPFYEQLQLIFAAPDTKAMEDYQDDPHLISSLFTPTNKSLSAIKEEEPPLVSPSEDIAGGPFLSVPGATISNRKRGRKGVDDAIAGAILQMAASAKFTTAVLAQMDDRYSIANCITELDKIEGEKGDLYFAALHLFNKPTAREIFLSLKSEKRLAWLQNKCTTPTITIT